MTKIIETIINKDFTAAKNLVNEKLEAIAERKMIEVKKMIAAKKVVEQEQDFIVKHQTDDRRERLKRDITEETQSDEEKWAIKGHKEEGKHLYWSNQDGWVNKGTHDIFSKDEKEKLNLPMGGKWVKHITEEQIDEARFKIVKARIRGGKVQRRKKVSTQPGMTFRGGKLVRMSPAERRKRKLGARKGKMKRRGKMAMIKRKQKMSRMKRQRLGL